MNSIITLIAVLASLMNPSDVNTNYYQEYDFIGELTTVEITTPRYEYSTKASEIGMMPVIEITAPKEQSVSIKWNIPEVIITASRYTNQDIKPYYGIMPEVVISADRYARPNGLFIFSQLSDNGGVSNISNGNNHARFDIYPLILMAASFALWFAAYLINRFRPGMITDITKRGK